MTRLSQPSSQLNENSPRLDNLRTIIPPFEETILKTLKQEGTPGLAVAIVSRNHVHYLKGFGVKRLELPGSVTPTSLFQLASISKAISATVLGILQQKGLCSLEDHPNKYLPDFFNQEGHKNLKIRHMLNHTSGITYDGFEELIESYTPRQEILQKLKETPVSSNPGQHFEYQNVVYGLIGDIMTALTGQTVDVILKDCLFNPLGMGQACVGLSALLDASDRSYPHREDLQGNLSPAAHYSHSYYIFPTSAGVNASVTDLIPFIQLYLGKFPNILSKKAQKELQTPTISATPSLEYLGNPRGSIKEAWYGLGWLLLNLSNERVVYHTGSLNGVRNFLGFLPDHDVGIVLLANANHETASKLGLEFFYRYLEA